MHNCALRFLNMQPTARSKFLLYTGELGSLTRLLRCRRHQRRRKSTHTPSSHHHSPLLQLPQVPAPASRQSVDTDYSRCVGQLPQSGGHQHPAAVMQAQQGRENFLTFSSALAAVLIPVYPFLAILYDVS